MNGTQSEGGALPNQLFEPSSFTSLSGAVIITWVTTNAVTDFIGGVDPKTLGFIVALLVALVGFFMRKERSIKKLLIVPFNGLLIYLTILGGTSFLPPPTGVPTGNGNRAPAEAMAEPSSEAATRDTTASGTTAIPVEEARSSFFSQWNPNRKLAQKTVALSRDREQLATENKQLQQKNKVYETKLDSTRRVIQQFQYQLPDNVKKQLIKTLDVSSTSMIENNLNLNHLSQPQNN